MNDRMDGWIGSCTEYYRSDHFGKVGNRTSRPSPQKGRKLRTDEDLSRPNNQAGRRRRVRERYKAKTPSKRNTKTNHQIEYILASNHRAVAPTVQ